MKKITFKRVLAVVPMIIMMVIIFGFSGENGDESGSLSLKIVRWLIDTFDIKWIAVDTLHIIVRKCAHMTEYGVLLLTCILALYDISRRELFAYILTLIYASSDEFHQSFIPGRCGTYKDVLIDMCGATIALLIYLLVRCIIRKRKNI